jgi:hypothetical protein
MCFFMRENSRPITDPGVWPWVLFPVLIALVAGYQALRKQRELLESFEITLGADFVVRKQKGYRDVEIRRDEVLRIVEMPGGWLLIETADRHKHISVLPGIENYDELRLQLMQWQEIQSASSQRMYGLLAVAASLALVLAHWGPSFVRDSPIAPIAHLIAAIGFVWLFMEMRHSPDVDEKSRRKSWVVLIPAAVELSAAIGKFLS